MHLHSLLPPHRIPDNGQIEALINTQNTPQQLQGEVSLALPSHSLLLEESHGVLGATSPAGEEAASTPAFEGHAYDSLECEPRSSGVKLVNARKAPSKSSVKRAGLSSNSVGLPYAQVQQKTPELSRKLR